MTHNRPLASIGLPAYNEARYIHQSIRSLLSQDYENIELVICDNASTDNTSDIVREFAAKDKRLKYVRNDANIGSIRNWNHAFSLASGKYFLWAGAHDLWHPSYISRCVEMLEGDTEIVLAYSQSRLIDAEGNEGEITPDRLDTRGLSPIERYKTIMWKLNWCNILHGVMRREVVAKTGLIPVVWDVERTFLAELTLHGAFAQIPEPLFYRRMVRTMEDEETKKRRVLRMIDPATAEANFSRTVPDLCRDTRQAHLEVVARAPIGFLEKLRARIATYICFRYKYGVGSMALEKFSRYLLPKDLRKRLRAYRNERIGQH